jgi:hypothetical protein
VRKNTLQKRVWRGARLRGTAEGPRLLWSCTGANPADRAASDWLFLIASIAPMPLPNPDRVGFDHIVLTQIGLDQDTLLEVFEKELAPAFGRKKQAA